MFENLKPESSAPAPLSDESCAAGAPASAGSSAGSGDGFVPAPGAPASAGSIADDPVEPLGRDDTELAGWKAALRWDFERWLASVDQIPEEGFEEAGPAPPDLYSFYAQLAAANAETRKANRRTAEAISQWGETLSRFDTSLAPLRETISQLTIAQAKDGKEGQMSRTHCLALVELLDRLQRIAKAFLLAPRRPRRTWWGGGAGEAWSKAWDSQRQAFAILLSHLEELLSKEGVVRLDTLGQRFDPLLMTAVAAEPDPSRPPQTVIEELAAGYRRHDELLRPAQVKVTTK